MRMTLTTCPYCGCGCGIQLVAEEGRVIGSVPSREHPVNRGSLCVKGWTSHEFIHHPERLTRPLIKESGKLVETSWDRAYRKVHENLTRIKERHGPDAISFFSSAKVTNEENYIFMKFARAVIGTNNIDHCARL